jgi:tRNA-dihydrouridine synthase 1
VEEDTPEINTIEAELAGVDGEEPPRKKRKKSEKKNQTQDPNLTAMQAHLFQMLRPLITKHTNIRDALARSRSGDIAGFERVLSMVEQVTKEGILEYEKSYTEINAVAEPVQEPSKDDLRTSSKAAMERCKRPWWICQPYIRHLPDEAIAKGAMSVSKKEKKKLEGSEVEVKAASAPEDVKGQVVTNGAVSDVRDEVVKNKVEVANEAIVCG